MLFAVMLGLFAPMQLLVTLILVIILTPELLTLMLGVIVVIVVLMALIIPAIFRNFEKRQARLDDVNNKVQENVTGIQVVKAFVREETEIERFNQRADAMRIPAYGAAFRVAFLSPLLTGVGQLAIITTMLVGGLQVLEGTGLNVGQVVAFTQYLGLAIAPLALMAIVIPMLLRADTSAERIFQVYDDVPEIGETTDGETYELKDVKGRIVFDNVTFAFRRPDGELDPPVLKNINLVIEPGQQVGFLGATGAGKSALVNLIPRFYDVTEGKITIDGVDVRNIPQDNLQQIVGIALQEAVLFKGDIRFNMKFANPSAEDEVMIGAAKAADSYGFVNNLSEKWDAPVSRRGYNFSGGQRQRLSINRALAQEPKILILDDSTSALDASTEGRVQGAIPEFTHGITTLYVAQRISAVIELDNVVLLQSGEIVAMGNHEELLESSELYQEIYESQLGGGVTAGLELEVE
jgi:ATP-binding cassette subfamily B protein